MNRPKTRTDSTRLAIAISVSVWIICTPQCRAQTTDSIVDPLMLCARAQLAVALQARAEFLPENRLALVGCGRWTLDHFAYRARAIAKKRVEITISRWIATLRINQAHTAFREMGQAETEERARMLRSAAENLRRAIRYSAQVYRAPALQSVVEKPALANQTLADCVRCYLITLAVIARDTRLINELDEMFVYTVKIAREIEEYDRWEAGIRRECAVLKTAISMVDLIRDLKNSRAVK